VTQYCRYCSLAVLNDDDLIYCEAKDEMREGKQIRNPNKCKHFEFNPVDVLDENKKYRPREPKKKNIEGQVSFLCGFVTRCGRAWTHFGGRMFRLHLSTQP